MAGMVEMVQVQGCPDLDYVELFRRLAEREREEINLTPYFTTQELNEMCDLEKRRYWNMKLNYEIMNEFDVPLGRPEFMDSKKSKAKQRQVDYSSSDSDEDWTPKKEREKERQEEMMIEKRRARKQKFEFPPIKKVKIDIAKAKREGQERAVAARKKKQKAKKSSRSRRLYDVEELFADDGIVEFFGFSGEEIHQSEKRYNRIQKRNKSVIQGWDSSRSRRIANTQEKPAPDESSRSSTRYPRRNIPKTDYAKIEVPDDDCFLYCEDCNMEHLGDCPVHGPLIVVEDAKTEPDDKLRADHSCPEGLVIKQSKIPRAGSGVWSTKGFPKGVRFGPYLGEIQHSEDDVHASGYGWQIFKNDKGRHYIDAKEVSASNWMRYVNCARHDSEQNLLAFQYMGNIYYKTITPVQSCEELMVWYGDEYARELGITKLASEDQMTDFQKDDRRPTIYQLLRNPDVKGYECEHCGIMFSKEEYLLVHKWRKHGVRLSMDYVCEVCSWRFPTNSRLQEHRSRVHKSKKSEITEKPVEILLDPNKENIDDRVDAPIDSLEESLETPNDAAARHTCCICRKLFLSENTLTVHMRSHTGEQPCAIVCKVCGKGFTRQGDLTRHKIIHSGEKPYICNICGKGFHKQKVLKSHVRTHSGEKPFSCNVCGKRFNSKGNMKRHMQTHSGEKPYTCNICGKGLTQQRNLTRHMRIHSGEKPYICSVCGKGFAQQCDLTKHMRTHSGERPYTCNVCGKGFNEQQNLNTHMRTHSGEKPYTCNVCGRGFARQNVLTQHMRTHSGEKPYICSVCGKGFAWQRVLTQHMRTHSGERPYSCSVCGKGFAWQRVLTEHMRTHTGERPYICNVCGKGFISSSSLKYHIRTNHADHLYSST